MLNQLNLKVVVPIVMVAVLILSLGLYFWWGIQITQVVFTPPENTIPVVDEEVTKCVGSLSNQTFFSYSSAAVKEKVLACDPRITSVTVNNDFPQKIKVAYTVLRPWVKYEKNEEECVAIESFTQIKNLSKDICLFYDVPKVTGAVKPDNSFMLTYITDIVRLLHNYQIRIEKITVQTDGYSSYYELETKSSKKILFPDNANLEGKSKVVFEAMKGLEQSKEGYSVLDVRIDTVIYR